MKALVIAEKLNNTISQATLSSITAAKKLAKVDLLVSGYNLSELLHNINKVDNITKILVCDNKIYINDLAEDLTSLILSVANDYDYIIFPSNTFGKNIAPRVSALLDVAQISDVIEIINSNTFVHPIYTGNINETIKSKDKKKVLTIRATSFHPISIKSNNKVMFENIDPSKQFKKVRYIERKINKLERPELTQAKIVISGGRALGGKEKFNELLNPLADKLNAAIGASRSAVDLGYASNDIQVGQTGKIISPQLYIAIGISGAIQHIAGIYNSKIVISINKDENAPIFNFSDYGLVADLFSVIPDLISKL